MTMIHYAPEEVDLMARLLEAEAGTDGKEGMGKVANVIVNRVYSECEEFADQRTITDVIYAPYQFEAVSNGLIWSVSLTPEAKQIALDCINGYWYEGSHYSLFYYNPLGGYNPNFEGNVQCQSTWQNEVLSGVYHQHCFYQPTGATETGVGCAMMYSRW